MTLVTTLRYRAITGDDTTASGAVTALIEEATELLAEYLGRPIVAAERTESIYPDRTGVLYPSATPVTVAADHTIAHAGHALVGSYPLGYPFTDDYARGGPVTVTYTGGYVERTANPAATNRLPVHFERDIAWAAYALGHRDKVLAGLPSGASAVSVGDVSVSFGGGGVGRSGDDMAIRWSATTRRYRRRSP